MLFLTVLLTTSPMSQKKKKEPVSGFSFRAFPPDSIASKPVIFGVFDSRRRPSQPKPELCFEKCNFLGFGEARFWLFFSSFRFDSSQIFRCCCAVVDSWKARPGFVEQNTCWNSIAMKLRIEIIWFVGFCWVELRRIELDYEMPQIGNNMMMPYDVCLVGFVFISKNHFYSKASLNRFTFIKKNHSIICLDGYIRL